MKHSQFRQRNIRMDDRLIECRSKLDRELLGEAQAIAEDETILEHISIGRLMLIRDACQAYSLGKHKRLVKMAIDRRNAGEAR